MKTVEILLILCCLVYCYGFKTSDAGGFSVNVNGDGSYNVVVQGQTWLKSAPTFFRADSKTFSLADGSLKLVKRHQTSGQDVVGKWTSDNFVYMAGSSYIETGFVLYTPDPSIFTYTQPFVVFQSRYLSGAMNTAINKTQVCSGFPGFQIARPAEDLGYLSFGGLMMGRTGLTTGEWDSSKFYALDGLDGGPLALFDKSKTANTLIISPSTEFMASTLWRQSDYLYWGVTGGVQNVPSGFQAGFIMFYGNAGINRAFEDWGKVLRTYYGRTDQYMKSDMTINYLGYWTDNGAYYYRWKEPYPNYQDLILAIVRDIKKTGIPFRYIQYDDWWYKYDTHHGIIEWVPTPDVFPNGLQWLFNKTQLPVFAHSMFWSNSTVYAKQNGGDYNFIIDNTLSLPVEERFWNDLMAKGKLWGLTVYEQDFMITQYEYIAALHSDVDTSKLWLKQMGNAAAKNGLTIQYCMALSNQILQALEIPVVTQARASHDYHPGTDNWNIGVSSLLGMAVGVAPYKDNFWTTSVEPNNPYKGVTEPFTRLNAAIATLSTGPVGPSDMVGHLNKTLIMRSANAEGLILKPSRPITAIDNRIRSMAWSDFAGPKGEVWSTYSDIGGLNKFGIILAANLEGSYSVTPSIVGHGMFPESMVFTASDPNNIEEFSEDNPLTLSGCTTTDFCLYYTAPVLSFLGHQVVIQGELDKWVPVSPQRVTSISQGEDIYISLTGAPSEMVVFYINLDGSSVPIKCILGQSGLATISIYKGACNPE